MRANALVSFAAAGLVIGLPVWVSAQTLSRVAEMTLFCGGWCPDETTPRPADLSGDGMLDLQDVSIFIASFTGGCP